MHNGIRNFKLGITIGRVLPTGALLGMRRNS